MDPSLRRPRILVLSRSNPQLFISGARIRNWQNIESLSNIADVSLFTIHIDSSQKNLPIPKHSLHSWRSYFVPFSIHQAVRSIISPTQIILHFFYNKNIQNQLKKVLHDFRPDIVLFEEIWLHAYLKTVQSFGCKIILDMHNVEQKLYDLITHSSRFSIRKIRSIALQKAAQIAEPDFVHTVDQVWVCSKQDKALVEDLYNPNASLYPVPNTINSHRYTNTDFINKKPTILFCANFDYLPNSQGAEWFIEFVLPLIKQRHPEIRIIFAGNNPSTDMCKAAQKDSCIQVTGYIPDVIPYLKKATIAVIPLHIGGGTRLKILEAIAMDLPIVSTTKGIEGFEAENGKNALIADNPNLFAQHISTLLCTPLLGQQLTWHARLLLQKNQRTYNSVLRSAITELYYRFSNHVNHKTSHSYRLSFDDKAQKPE